MRKKLYKLISRLGFRIENKKKIEQVKSNNLEIYKVFENKNLLLKSFDFVQKIQKKYPELKISDHGKGVIVEFDSFKIYVETYEEFFIIDEVFVQDTYNFFIDKKSVIIDIGANIGISSLFFSRQTNIEKIYAYEPVQQSFEQAKKNLNLNNISDEIVQLFNIGLSDEDKTETFLFNSNVKGNTGVRGKLSASFKENLVVETEVLLKDASTQIRKVINENPGLSIVVKMDCEGGEYPIFKNIFNSEILKEIDCIMMEWHDKGATDIEEYLKKSGFVFFSQQLAFNSGMIYANKK